LAGHLTRQGTPSGVTGSPILTDALGWMDCRCEAGSDNGVRTSYLGRVVHAELALNRLALAIKNLLRLAAGDQLQESGKPPRGTP
jgi:flavin reductase (DIM6/NTAB) family NADH-FMN oxidoreductase RutF